MVPKLEAQGGAGGELFASTEGESDWTNGSNLLRDTLHIVYEYYSGGAPCILAQAPGESALW